MQAIYAVYGASGFGREVMPLLKQQLPAGARIYFIDDGCMQEKVNNVPVVNFDKFCALKLKKFVSIAIGDSKIRESLERRLADNAIGAMDVHAKNVYQMENISIGSGSVLCPFVTLTSNIHIGKQFHANIYSYVAHDCIIGDFVTFAPRVCCNGNVHIHDHAYIGTGAVIKQGTPDKPLVIGEGAVVGMGAVVTKDVPAGSVVVGNPARPLVKI